LSCLFLACFAVTPGFAAAARKPNVIILLTDDQGYGEIAAHGNPVIKTPNIDKLHSQSVKLTDFHVDPTCSPTRAALMTGRYSTRTGVWHTINGRSLLNPDEVTLGELFKSNGYATGMIGKWHLGDNYPSRPQDQGFDYVAKHLGGGIGNGGDYWENDYYDDTFQVNGEFKKLEGYCTDVWFREATRFVEKNRDRPFFLYLPTNAPHGPYVVPDSYSKPYLDAGLPPNLAKFYGMIANLDENLGQFREKLTELGLDENTLLIYMTDNGTAAGWIDEKENYPYFNAGMRGWKSSALEGGHRVPCFWHWPKGNLKGGRDVSKLTAHIDILPTLVDLLDLKKPEGPTVDGISLKAPLKNLKEDELDRTLFVHVQRAFLPPKWDASVCMKQKWRLIEGKELYDIKADPDQKNDIAAGHPEVVEKLRGDYEIWWTSLKPAMEHTVHIGLGGDENPMTLYSHDWLMPGTKPSAWHQNHIQRGELINGAWAVDVKQAGNYEISLYRWPSYLNKAMNMKHARLKIGGVEREQEIEASATKATFKVKLSGGPVMLQTWLRRTDDKEHGAYFTEVRKLDE
jgi:arylsulfatase A-like enzyme